MVSLQYITACELVCKPTQSPADMVWSCLQPKILTLKPSFEHLNLKHTSIYIAHVPNMSKLGMCKGASGHLHEDRAEHFEKKLRHKPAFELPSVSGVADLGDVPG